MGAARLEAGRRRVGTRCGSRGSPGVPGAGGEKFSAPSSGGSRERAAVWRPPPAPPSPPLPPPTPPPLPPPPPRAWGRGVGKGGEGRGGEGRAGQGRGEAGGGGERLRPERRLRNPTGSRRLRDHSDSRAARPCWVRAAWQRHYPGRG